MTTPTQAQIEAIGLDAIKDELKFQRSKGSVKAIGLQWALDRLTAAAEAVKSKDPYWCYSIDDVNATIERCAQRCDDGTQCGEFYAAAIRAMKD